MTINEVKVEDLILFAKIDEVADEYTLLEAILEAGKQFILSQTGLTEEEANQKQDLAIAMLMICADMYDNRSYAMTVGKVPHINPAANAIINQYCRNIL